MNPKALELASRRLESSQRMMPVLQQKAADPVENVRHVFTASLAWEYHAIGVATYFLQRDAQQLREKLRRCVALHIELCEIHDRGGTISPDTVTWLGYKKVFYALAAGDLTLARKTAAYLRTNKLNGSFQEGPFDRAMGRMVRASVLAEGADIASALDTFREICTKKGNSGFAAYGDFFACFHNRDVPGMNAALARIATDHVQKGRRGVFLQTLEAYLCLWGLGACNLARLRGLPVEINHEVIPRDLLAPLA